MIFLAYNSGTGFLIEIVGCVLWIAMGILTNLIGIVVVNVALIIISIVGYIKRNKS